MSLKKQIEAVAETLRAVRDYDVCLQGIFPISRRFSFAIGL